MVRGRSVTGKRNVSVLRELRNLVSFTRPNSNGGAGGRRSGRASSRRNMSVRGVLGTARGNGIDLVTDLRFGLMNYVNNPKTIITLMVVFALVYSHTLENADGVLHNFAGRYPGNKLLAFIVTNLIKVIGCVAFLPTLVAMPKTSMPLLISISVILCVGCLPPANFYQYLGLAVILHMYCHARVASSRVCILIIFVGYVLVLHEMMKQLPPLASLIHGDDSVVSTMNRPVHT